MGILLWGTGNVSIGIRNYILHMTSAKYKENRTLLFDFGLLDNLSETFHVNLFVLAIRWEHDGPGQLFT